MSSIDLRPERRSGIPRPWRRHHIDDELAPLLAEYQTRHRRADTTLIELAFEGARRAHAEQVRRSGEPYLAHPLGVAMIVAELGLDDITIAGALLHDSVEDTNTMWSTSRGPSPASPSAAPAAAAESRTACST
jgi:hypothetical protein